MIRTINICISVLATIIALQISAVTAGHADTNKRWYPNYSINDFNKGICITLSPAPAGIVTYESQLTCCKKSYAGQSSGACIISLPDSIKATLKKVWFPVYSDQSCVSTEFFPRNHGVTQYETQLDCCMAEYGHGDADVSTCVAGLPNPPTTSPTPVGGLKLDVWYPDYGEYLD